MLKRGVMRRTMNCGLAWTEGDSAWRTSVVRSEPRWNSHATEQTAHGLFVVVACLQLPRVLLRLRKHSSNVSSAVSSSGAIQQLHSELLVQAHWSSLLRAPVSFSLVR